MGRLQFDDFELRIGRGQGRAYPTWVVRSPAGEANGTFRLPFGPKRLKDIKTLVELAMLRSRQRTRAALSSELRDLRAFGGDLFDALFRDTVGAAFESSRNLALSGGKGLRLKLRIEPGELIDLPWELLYDKTARRFVALSARMPMVRYVELEAPLPPLKLTPPLCLLVVIASPSNYAALDVERETHRIRLALGELISKGLMQVDFLPNATVPALQDRLRESPVHILHFIGHGGYFEERETGVLVFEDERGEGRRVRGEQLRHLFGDVLTLRLVVLNACNGARGWDRHRDPLKAYPGIAESLVHEGIAGVVANQFEVTDEAAIILARELYSALADGFPIDAAVAEARKAIDLSLKNTVEWASPVLYSRAPDGLVFDMPATEVVEPVTQAELRPALPPEPADSRAVRLGNLVGWAIKSFRQSREGASAGTAPATEGVWHGGRLGARPFDGPALELRRGIKAPLRLLALVGLGALLFMFGFAVASAIPRLTSPLVLPTITVVEPSATAGVRQSPTAKPLRATVSPTPVWSPAASSTNTLHPTATPAPRVRTSRALVVGTEEGFSSYHLRQGPSTLCPVVGPIPSGVHVTALGGWSAIDDARYPAGWGWILVETRAGQRAWLWGTAVRVLDPETALSEVAADDVPACAPLAEPLPGAATPDSDSSQATPAGQPAAPREVPPTATPSATAVPTAVPTEPTSAPPTPATVHGIPRPPTPTPVDRGW